MSNFEEELVAIEQQIASEPNDGLGITSKQLGVLNNLICQGLSDPKDRGLRLHVVRVLVGNIIQQMTGYQIESTKQIPSVVAKVLIQLFKEPDSWELSDQGRWLIESAEQD